MNDTLKGISSNIKIISKNDLIKLINNQGEYRKFYVEFSKGVTINFKHIRPRKRKGDSIPQITTTKGCLLEFD